jgi:ribosome-associated heat shock protein Hsp15
MASNADRVREPGRERIRVDKWLWAARLVKTRAVAVEAVKAGRVKVNGVAAKPSKEVGAGDRLELRTGPVRMDLLVAGVAPRRGPASEAAELYEETAESRAARERHAQERRLARQDGGEGGRPTKRDRRRIERVKGKRR